MPNTIAHRKIGSSGLTGSPIGLGGMSLSGVYGPADDAESEDLIRYAIDQGVDHIDSSDMYGWGHNETLIGRAIKGRRDRHGLRHRDGTVASSRMDLMLLSRASARSARPKSL